MPYTVFGEDDNAPAERVPIEELLAADEYKEGEVLAVMKPSSSVFSDQGEELSQISAESLKETVKAAKEADLPPGGDRRRTNRNGFGNLYCSFDH